MSHIFYLLQLAMEKISAGLLMYRRRKGNLEIFLVHPGGPLWAKKDLGSWSVPKGLPGEGEDLLSAARREFEEETGFQASGDFIPLSPVKLKGGKVIHAWAFEGDCDPSMTESNTFSMEWPPRSGNQQEFPEIDRAGWFDAEEAKKKINPGQAGLLEELEHILSGS
jgi:predicted NUDIX family NTP pyrophosphohydrolase